MGDIWEQLARYRKIKTLADGSRVLLRPLTKDDKQALVDLFARASKEDLEFFRDDTGDPIVVESWVENLDLQRVYPLVAVVDEGDRGGGRTIVGDATLHLRKRYHRHLAWVRIFLDRSYRRRGIGTLLLSSLIEIARNAGLQQLYAEIVTTQHQPIKAFQAQGFQHEATLQDYFTTSSGETLDMVILSLRLADRPDEF
jgi:L-amino acid N-acyltransferase YncA